MVSRLAVQAERNKQFLDELLSRRDEKVAQREAVVKVVEKMVADDVFIDSAAFVHSRLPKEVKENIKPTAIREVMKVELGMSYKKVLPVAIKANSERNLVLRQRFALELIELLQKGKTVLNIDETWLGMSDFRRRKWRAAGTTNSVPQLQICP